MLLSPDVSPVSERSGEADCVRIKSVLGGDLGESICTSGASFGDDCMSIDIGLL